MGKGLLVSLGLMTFLSGCGVEAVGSAATGAAVKQQELQQARQTQEQIQQDLGKALQTSDERKRQMDAQ